MSSFNENPPQDEDPDPRILHTGEGKILIGVTVEQIDMMLGRTHMDAEIVAKLEKARALLEYSIKREAYVKGT
jgi:hypothetical protein